MMKRFIDIGANLTDPMYTGVYHGNKKHEADLNNVLSRAWNCGLQKIIVTGGSLNDSQAALNLAKIDERLFSTVGCHPTKCDEFKLNSEQYLSELENLIVNNKQKVVALGECGLDYDRLHFCSKEIQRKYFDLQLKLAVKIKLPLFLHCRNASEDFLNILSKYPGLTGVVHSFDGSCDDVQSFLQLGFHIGLNGCSLKTENNLNVIKTIPIDRLMIETDAPWCEVRPTHAGYKFIQTQSLYQAVKKEKWNQDMLVKGRNEPCQIRQILEIIATVRNIDADQLSETIFSNTNNLFFNK